MVAWRAGHFWAAWHKRVTRRKAAYIEELPPSELPVGHFLHLWSVLRVSSLGRGPELYKKGGLNKPRGWRVGGSLVSSVPPGFLP